METAIISALYVAFQMMADIGSLRIVTLFGLAIDGGTLVYPFTFVLRDLLHKSGGAKVARAIVILAGAINVVMVALFWAIAILPPDVNVGLQNEFTLVFAPTIRIVIASIVAEIFSQLLDTEVYKSWENRFKHKYQFMRLLSSNALSIPLDSLLFCILAFYGNLPLSVIFEIMLFNIAIKFGITIITLPTIYLVHKG